MGSETYGNFFYDDLVSDALIRANVPFTREVHVFRALGREFNSYKYHLETDFSIIGSLTPEDYDLMINVVITQYSNALHAIHVLRNIPYLIDDIRGYIAKIMWKLS